MKLPKKISPDRIKDAIIEFRYSSNFPFEVIVGLIYKELISDFTFANRPAELISEDQIPIKITHGGQNLFFNENIKVHLLPNCIIVNCNSNYIGWDTYKEEILKLLVKIYSSNSIQFFSRLGIRYISEYHKIDLSNCIKFKFTFAQESIISKTYSFKTEFDYKQYNCILNIHNKLVNLTDPTDYISVIDIDIIKNDLNIQPERFNEFINLIDDAHTNEKEIFYNLLKTEFLNSLNPEY